MPDGGTGFGSRTFRLRLNFVIWLHAAFANLTADWSYSVSSIWLHFSGTKILLTLHQHICSIATEMPTYSTRQAAKKLGITDASLVRYIKAGKVPKPKSATSGGMTIHFWTEKQIEQVRQLLPKIANGRKTRYQKQKTKPQAKKPVPKKK